MRTRPAPFAPGHEIDLMLAVELLHPQVATDRAATDVSGIHMCSVCRLPFIVPRSAREIVGDDRIHVDLDCVNCGWSGTGLHGDEELAALDAQLDHSYADLLWTLEVVWTANEESAIQRFSAALQAGAILPEDF